MVISVYFCSGSLSSQITKCSKYLKRESIGEEQRKEVEIDFPIYYKSKINSVLFVSFSNLSKSEKPHIRTGKYYCF